MANSNAAADNGWMAVTGDVDGSAVLNVGAFANCYWGDITADYGVKPNAGSGADDDIADDICRWRNEGGRGDFWVEGFVGKD